MLWLVLFSALFLPGACIASIWGKREHVLLLATPLSLFLFTSISLFAQLLDISHWILELYLASAFLLLLLSISLRTGRACLQSGLMQFAAFLPLFIAIVAYQLVAGAFVDFGADVYQHMVLVQSALTHMEQYDGALKFAKTIGTKNYIFHNIAAVFLTRFGLSAAELIETFSIAYSCLWTVGVFCFSKFVLRTIGVDKQSIFAISVLAVFFYWTGFGINNFSFARYYIGGPAILTYGVYLACVVLLIGQFTNKISISDSILLVFLLATAMVIHPQEAILFIAFSVSMATTLLLYYMVGVRDTIDLAANLPNVFKSAAIVVLVALSIFLVILFQPKYRFDPVPLRNLGLFSERLIDWNILRPNHQFYTVLGLWGLYVYVLAAINFSVIKRRIVLVASLLIPLLTVFNPFFAEAYMRLAYPQVLWRLLFALPLPVIAAYLSYITYEKIRSGSSSSRFVGVLSFIPLLVFLVAFRLGPVNNLMAKSPSLIKTPVENSHRYWADMLELLETIDQPTEVLTDPSTGYLIRSFTKHDHHGFKFYKQNYRDYNFEHYLDNPLSKYSGWLLVINKRDGEINTRLSRPYHIYPDVMKVEKHYSAALLDEVSTHPDRYQNIWSGDDIYVYKIL